MNDIHIVISTSLPDYFQILLVKNNVIKYNIAHSLKEKLTKNSAIKIFNSAIQTLFGYMQKEDKSITINKCKKTIDEAKVHLLELIRIAEYAKRKRGEKT